MPLFLQQMKEVGRYDVPIEIPVSTDDTKQQVRIATGGLSIHLIVGAHNTSNISIKNTALEGWLERVIHVLLCHLMHIEQLNEVMI